MFGWLFMPLAWVMGVDWSECNKVGELIGLKTIVNEFVAYARLSEMLKAGELSVRVELTTKVRYEFTNSINISCCKYALIPLPELIHLHWLSVFISYKDILLFTIMVLTLSLLTIQVHNKLYYCDITPPYL